MISVRVPTTWELLKLSSGLGARATCDPGAERVPRVPPGSERVPPGSGVFNIQACADWINSHYNVAGVHQKFPERLQELVDNEAERLDH